MANYYLDENGRITTQNTTKKRNQRKKGKSYILGDDGRIKEVETLGGEEDIAPVRETAKKEEKEDDSKLDFFQKGLFDDGYDAGDITKTILGTAGDIGLGLVKGVAKIGEGAGKAIATGVAGVADKIGQDEYAARVRKNLKESAIDNLTEGASDYLDDRSVLGRTSRSIVEGVGQVGGILATGGMGAAAGLGTAGVTALTTGVTGVSSFGHGVGEAYKGGAKEGEAELYGLIAGAADAGTELLFGGLGKAVKAKGLSTGILNIDDALAKKVSSLFSNQIAKNITEYGIKSSAEGFEEFLAGVVQAAGKYFTYMSDEEFEKILEDENLLEQFVVGAVTSGIAQAPSLVQSTQQGRDFVTGRTENEEAVISKEVEKRIEEAKAEGKTLSKKEEAAIAEQVEKDMEKGRISTDTIEEVLGGEAYEKYKKVSDMEDSLTKEEETAREEFNTLNRMKKGDMTGEQTDRLEELRTKLTDISSRREKMTQDHVKDNLKKNLSDEVSAFVKNDRLIESYNEKARRSQAFEADLEAYSPEQRKVVEKAVKSGILNNTNRTHEFVDIVAKISADKGVLFDFTNNKRLKESGFSVEGATVNGYITKDGIVINMDSPKAWQSTVGHEITHVLKGTEVYAKLQTALFEYAKAKNDYQGRYDTVAKLYKGKNVKEELTADLVGDYLFTDEAFVNSLSTKHRNVFQKIYDEIKYLAKIVTAGSKEARQLEKVKRAFDKAYKAQGNTQDGSIAREKTEASISKASEQQVGSASHGLTKEQQAYFKDSVVRDENGNLKVMYHGTSQGGHTMFDPYGKARYGLFGAGSYFTDSKAIAESYTKKGKGNQPQVYETYLNITNPIDMDAPAVPAEWKRAMPDVDFPKSGTNEEFYRVMEEYFEGNEYPRWEAAETAMEVIEGMGYDGITHIGGGRVNADGERHQVYIAFRPEQIKNIDNAKPTSDPDIRYSLGEDSDGGKLSKGQSEYFKDSKIRDENGSLRVMYHGTPNGDFTVFRDGTYFTANKEYADKYQNPSASSLNSRKVASSPKTFSVYLNITKPFDINDAEARNIYINDYIKGGNAIGINPYLSDAEYAKIKSIDWTEGEDLREFLVENGYDYDGLVLDEGAVGGYGEAVEYRGTSYVVFSPEQVKTVDNLNPSSDPDIRFSLDVPIEETRELMAIHNLHTSEVLKQLGMGGLVYPSVAITNPGKIAHGDFGDVSLILKKDAVDPKSNKYNKIYSTDAYTPTFPHISYEANSDAAESVIARVKAQFDKLPDYYQRSIRSLRDYTNLNDVLNRWGGFDGIINNYIDDHGMKQLYLAEKGEAVPMVIDRTEAELTDYEKLQYQTVVDRLGESEINALNDRGYFNTLGDARIAWTKEHLDVLKDIYADLWASDGTMTKSEAMEIADEQKLFYWSKEAIAALHYLENGGVTIVEKENLDATNAKVDEKVAGSDYKQWLYELFSGIEGKSGIRNSKDTFSPSGKRRGFSQLHDPVTIDNVIKAMRKKDQKGEGAFGIGNIYGASAETYNTIDEAKKHSGELGVIEKDEYDAIKERIENRLYDIAGRYANGKDIIDAKNTLVEAVAKCESKAQIERYLKQYDYVYKYTESIADDLISLRDYIRSLPRPYFEAKPQRAVGFDEVGVFVIPRNADVKLKQELLNRGYAIAEYDPDVDGDRQKVVNSFEEYKFSLSDAGQTQKRYGNFATPASDLRLEAAPVREDIAPAQEAAPVKKTATTAQADEYAPISEAEANALQEESLASLGDADAPPEAEAPYYGEGEDMAPDDPFEDRDIKEVGNRKVKAYMYENPEVKPFFQDEAKIMLGELERTIKGEKIYTEGDFGGYGGDSYYRWTGTKRQTSEDIAYLLDEHGYTYAEIEKGLNAIIEDDGKENNAVSKRIEFLLNDRLLKGYQDDTYGLAIPPNQDYVNLLNEKQITEYNEEAQKRLFETADANAPAEDIAPVRETVAPPAADDIAPVKEFEAVTPRRTPKKKTANRMRRVDVPLEHQKIAEILDEEPTAGNRKSRAWAKFRANFLDKGSVFEDLALKTKNRELMGKWNYMLYSEARAQRLIGSGADGVKPLNTIIEEVGETGKTKQFYEYLYHMHNIDRMSLAERYEDVPNKAVFGDSVTADVSREAVKTLARENPEFRQYAQDVYEYNSYLRSLLVEGGVISQETADLWAEMYPHYVPIRRAGDTGLNVNVPLDTGRTSVNGPVKKATGGNSDILPLFDTMALRTIQTYRAIAKNSFGVELKNTLGTTVSNEQTSVDDVIDSIDTQDSLLQKGQYGRNPTFTVFENGEKVTYEITEDMYDAMKPMSEGLADTFRPFNAISNFHRGVLTEYNPVFMLTNAIKDIQDMFINSQHPLKTYAKIPEAFAQLTRKGYWYNEYMGNGGDQNSYFDNETNTFKTENKGLARILDIPPLSTISKLNNYIEMIPRLAEYIASREAGRSVEVSMLDAARVTTNFRAAGDISKFLNRNGATFLTASISGAMQQVRNVREAKANGAKGWASLAAKFAIAGIPALILNHLVWDDDDEYEELSDYVKQNYYIVGKTDGGKFIRIPKGRTIAAIQTAIDQTVELATGHDELDYRDFLGRVLSNLANLAPNNPIEDNILAPIIDVYNNETWYGGDLVPQRLQDLPAAEQYDESTDAFSKWLGNTKLGKKLGISPVKANYLLDQYSGGVGDVVLPMMTPEAESGDNSFWGNVFAPLKSKFSTDGVMNNQNVSDFYDTKDDLTTEAKKSAATDRDILMSKYMNSMNSDISNLYAEKRKVQNSNLPDDEKYARVREIQGKIVDATREALETYEDITFENDYREGGEYARIGDRVFKKDDDGEWVKLSDEQLAKYEVTRAAGDASYASDGENHYRWYVPDEDSTSEEEWKKITDKQLKKQRDVQAALGISPEDYWSNKEEYDYAYEYPEKYAVAKAVGGYQTYKSYSKALNDIEANKDENDKSISGSRKEKVISYIDGLNADYGEKIILFKSEYNADDTYNYEIIDYLNSREDISYLEMVTILRELGFTVSKDGNITW
jgi:hypothetical protein